MLYAQSVRTIVTCIASSLIVALAVPAPAPADAPTLLVSLGIRETDQAGDIGTFTNTIMALCCPTRDRLAPNQCFADIKSEIFSQMET